MGRFVRGLALVAAMIVVTACGGSGRSPDEVEILSIPDRFAVALENKDASALEALFADEVVPCAETAGETTCNDSPVGGSELADALTDRHGQLKDARVIYKNILYLAGDIAGVDFLLATRYTDDSTGEFGVAVDLQRINGAWLIVKIVLREL